MGAGLVLDRGVDVVAAWAPAGPRGVSMESHPRASLRISREVARRLALPFGGTITVKARHGLPIGQGLGMSAAGAVATALAVGSVLRVPSRKAWETAHLAELTLRGGLGGVAAIRGGGLEWRRTAGLPPRGEVVHRRVAAEVFVRRLGPPIDTREALENRRLGPRIRVAGREAIRRFARRPSLATFADCAERFTDALGLGSPAMRTEIDRLRGEGWWAAQAMFGNLVFAIPGRAGLPTRRADSGAPVGGRWWRTGVGSIGARTVRPRRP